MFDAALAIDGEKIAFMLLLLLLASGGESCLIFLRGFHVRVGRETLQ